MEHYTSICKNCKLPELEDVCCVMGKNKCCFYCDNDDCSIKIAQLTHTTIVFLSENSDSSYTGIGKFPISYHIRGNIDYVLNQMTEKLKSIFNTDIKIQWKETK